MNEDKITSQCLPIAKLSQDWEGEVEDGETYLFTVQRQAASRPLSTRASIPSTFKPKPAPAAPTSKRKRKRNCPSIQWRDQFIQNFQNLRQHTEVSTLPSLKSAPVGTCPYPGRKDVPGWARYTATVNPHPAVMKSLDQGSMISVISYLSRWVTEQSSNNPEDDFEIPTQPGVQIAASASSSANSKRKLQISDQQAKWAFALFTFLPGQLSGEEISTLRELGRAIISTSNPDDQATADEETDEPSDNIMVGGLSKESWMMLAIIGGVWGQKDLWWDIDWV